ncbi:MAG: nucleotide disphospho-sugar-binding domain-containing protein [Wenzhouxiangella sp.]|jgi:hypothetical protein|nr:nucleotide disphospho-sugar-binding domain-containing protein [Wenzhouxiangella sp.]
MKTEHDHPQDTTSDRQARILMTWEFGGALGHLARLRPLALRLVERGHRVHLAFRPNRYEGLIPRSLGLLPVPGHRPVRDPIAQPVNMADILFNHGVTDREMLAGQVRAWRGLFELVRPDVVVMDYSPIALLALQGLAPATLQLGTGFASPPAIDPLPGLRAWQSHYPERVQRTERSVLDSLNRQLTLQGEAPLGGVGELFGRVDANLLATFRELDHYPQRSAGSYLGTWPDLGGVSPEWPIGEGPRIFAYLKPFRQLPALLSHLRDRGWPTLVFAKGLVEPERWTSETLMIVDRPLDMQQVARQCDAAILNAGHGTTAELLLAGKPVVQVPLNVEQFHNAANTERLGAGVHARADRVDSLCQAIDALVSRPEYAEAARAFRRRYADHDPRRRIEQVVDRIESLAGRWAMRSRSDRE